MDKFLQDYIAAALWTSTDENDEPLDGLYNADDLSPETLEQMKEDCEEFQRMCEGRINETSHPGHDFWLTRNGHGAGFWDGEYPVHGTFLTQISKSFSSLNLYVGDDGLVYHQ